MRRLPLAISRSFLSSTFPNFETSFARIRGLEDLVQFFQGTSLSLNEEKVDKSELKAVPEHEEDIEPVLDLQAAVRNIAPGEGMDRLTSRKATGAAKVLTNPAVPAVN